MNYIVKFSYVLLSNQEKGTFDKKHKKNIFYSLSNEKELE